MTIVSLDKIICDVASHLRQSNIKSDESACKVVIDSVLTLDTIRAALQAVRGSDVEMSTVGQRSYRHPNGFTKIVIADSAAPEFKIRAHLWDVGSKVGDESDIHNHRWNYASRILSGSFDHTVFCTDCGGDDVFRMRYEPRRGKQTFRMRMVGSEQLAPQIVQRLHANETYSLGWQVPHRIDRCGDGPHATFVLQGRTYSESTDVYVYDSIRSGGKDLVVDVPSLSTSELGSHLDVLLSILKNMIH